MFFVDSDVYVQKDTLAILRDRVLVEGFSCAVPLVRPVRQENVFEKFEDLRHRKVFGVASRPVRLSPTYAFLIGRKTFEAAGCFDETFKLAAAEDYDLSMRLGNAGYTIFHSTDALVYHDHSSDIRSLLRRSFAYGQEGVKFTRKHGKVRIELLFMLIGLLCPVRAYLRYGLSLGHVGCCYDFGMLLGRIAGFFKYCILRRP